MKLKLSKISAFHYWKLVYRSALLLVALVLYIVAKLGGEEFSRTVLHNFRWVFGIIWLVYAVEMVLRLFPSSYESMGCQKQFKKNHKPTGNKLDKPSEKPIWAIFFAWIALNGAIYALYFTHIIDKYILLMVALAYGVCDMICILFFCPFQTWFMKNKCCGSCRIYNWDYAMMFTPLLLIPSLYTWSLLGLALVLLVGWEWTYFRHPERFYEQSNESLKCANCPEKLCHHKKQLRSFLKKRRIELCEELKKRGF